MNTTLELMHRPQQALACLGCLLGLLVWGGCQHYEVDVKLESDGSGLRKVTLLDDGGWQEASTPPAAELRQLFCVTEEQGWRPVAGPADEGEEKGDSWTASKGFWRERRIADLAGWYEQSGDVHIRGTLANEDPFDQVRFSNSLAVEIGESPHGRTYNYSETFAWAGLQDIVVDFLADHFSQAMARAYPALGKAELAELRGLMAGHLSLGWFTMAVTDELEENAHLIIQSLANQVEAVVRRVEPEVDRQQVQALVEQEVLLQGDDIETYLEEKLPGFFAVGFTEVNLRVTMPGTIVETNGERQDDHTVTWQLDVFAAAASPVRLHVRSHVVD